MDGLGLDSIGQKTGSWRGKGMIGTLRDDIPETEIEGRLVWEAAYFI